MRCRSECTLRSSLQSLTILRKDGQDAGHISNDLRIIAIAYENTVATMIDEFINSTHRSCYRHTAELLRFGNHQRRAFPSRRHQENISPCEMVRDVSAVENRR
ncbi:hypothetical protein D9M69_559820 [compost metagenome]